MSNLYVFGNEYLSEDSLAREVASHLENVSIVHCKHPDDLLLVSDTPIQILDVVKGINTIKIITDIDDIRTRNIMTMHDFDLGYFLTLLKELGEEKQVRIIGIPQSGNVLEIAKEVQACL